MRETDFLDGDMRIDAPELAARGSYKVGVRTVRVVNRNEIDILNRSAEDPYPTYNRKLKLEVWYPSRLYHNKKELTTYHDVLGSGPDDPERPLRPFKFAGRAIRGAMPNLAGIQVPSLFIAGKQDQTSGYPNIEWFFENAVNSDRYLLAYESAIHEVAVNPAPPLAWQRYREFIHYQEPGWDNRRLNNINQHFITAFLGKYIQGDAAQFDPFLDLIEPVSNDSPRDDESDPRYWKGFPNYSAIGMELRHLTP